MRRFNIDSTLEKFLTLKSRWYQLEAEVAHMPSEDAEHFMRLFVSRLYGLTKALGDTGLESLIGRKEPEGTAPVPRQLGRQQQGRQ